MLFSALLCVGCKNQQAQSAATETDSVAVTAVKVNADSAFASIEAQCAFGPRVPNSAAHKACGDYIAARFRALGLTVTEQAADLRAWDGQVLRSRNIIAAYRPELADRILLCAHWESRPWADADPDSANHRQPVMAANDGASGVAVMLEVARLLGELKPEFGVDFICFDAEDYGVPYWGESQAEGDGSDWCLGSQYSAAIRPASASCSTWWAEPMPDSATRVSPCAMPATWWCACGTQPSVPGPPASLCRLRAAMPRTTTCPSTKWQAFPA